MTRADSIEKTADAVLTNHRVVRDGNFWTCRHCKSQWPFPSPLPDDAGQCAPRRWGDGLGEAEGS